LKRSYKQTRHVFYRINHQIFAREMRLLDDTGKQIGVLTKDAALKKSREAGLDLVEIAPKAVPPVVKLIDYNKFLYQLKKKKQEEKKSTSKSETKEMRSGPFIDDHDLDIKIKKVREFLEDGDKVRFVVRFRGREMGRQDMGRAVLQKVIERLGELVKVDREPKMEGRQLVILLSRASKTSTPKIKVEEEPKSDIRLKA